MQSGFRTNHSTETANCSFLEWFKSKLDIGGDVSTVFLDLKKAFETVNHEVLLFKLSSLNVSPEVINKLTEAMCHTLTMICVVCFYVMFGQGVIGVDILCMSSLSVYFYVFWPDMVLNQWQVFGIVSDWERYLGSLWVIVCVVACVCTHWHIVMVGFCLSVLCHSIK